jgi:hypothetical protein
LRAQGGDDVIVDVVARFSTARDGGGRGDVSKAQALLAGAAAAAAGAAPLGAPGQPQPQCQQRPLCAFDAIFAALRHNASPAVSAAAQEPLCQVCALRGGRMFWSCMHDYAHGWMDG